MTKAKLMKSMKTVLAAGLFVSSLQVMADDFSDGNKAYDSGKYKRAFKLYEKACNYGDNRACDHLGILYNNGLGVKKDIIKANELFEKACNHGIGSGCGYLASSYESGDGVNKDVSKAIKLYEKGCDLENGSACHALGLLYGLGEEIAQDKKKAKELYRRACDLKFKFGCEDYYKHLRWERYDTKGVQ